jgi:oxygen-independent coproporphyrinogen III oxidase
MALMCQGRVDFESIELAHLIKMKDYFGAEIESLASLAEGGLVEVGDDHIQVTASGWFYVRGIAMAFDKYLRAHQARERFSRII